MNAKRADKIATAVFYIISVFIVVLLGAFIAYILYKGGAMLKPSFLFGKPKDVYKRQISKCKIFYLCCTYDNRRN